MQPPVLAALENWKEAYERQQLAAAATLRAAFPSLVLLEPPWVAAAAKAGIRDPILANRNAAYAELGDICRAATGFVYAPAAAGQQTGYSAGIDLDGLAAFVQSVQQFAPSTPILTGIGVSTPELASAIVGRVDVSGVVIGSPLVRSLRSGAVSLHQTAPLVEEFVAGLAVGSAA